MPKQIAVRSSDGHKVVDRVPLARAYEMVRAKQAEWTGNQPVIQLFRKRYDHRGISCNVNDVVIMAYTDAKNADRVTAITESIDGLPLVRTAPM